MAIIHPVDRAIVLRIVYDGPPEAGKTTSVKALARSFGREVYTPEEQDGRTVYFDWLEHTGGRFDGAPIRCQIVSVPGQECWAERRAHLLERADVVVFVGDTSAPAWPATVARFHDLRSRLEARPAPAVGIVFQANYRDSPDALALEVVRKEAGSERVAIVESVAFDGTGVREAFVFAVRLALDRVREEQRLGQQVHATLDLAGEDLLRELRKLEVGLPDPAAVQPRLPEVKRRVVASEGETPAHPRESRVGQGLPSHEVPSGLIWPPVEGRILLREVMTTPVKSFVTECGDYRGTCSTGHRAHSAADAVFDDLEEGREMLIAWARTHVSAQPLLSKGRCIVLAATGDGRFRLWQIVRAEPSVRHLFIDGCDSLIPRHAARQLATASRLLTVAQTACERHSLRLPCTLDSIGLSDAGQPIYIDDLALTAPPAGAASGAELVVRELATIWRARTVEDRAELCRELVHLQKRDLAPAHAARIERLVTEMLTQ